MLLIILAALVVAILLYAVFVREWLKCRPWAAGFFAFIEPIELVLWRKSETILFARLKIVVGLLLAVLTQFGEIDLTPLMPLVPDQYEAALRVAFNLLPLFISIVGWMDEKLRNGTTKPLEVVALPDDLPPEVAKAIEKADVAKDKAVAVAVEAKEAGAV